MSFLKGDVLLFLLFFSWPIKAQTYTVNPKHQVFQPTKKICSFLPDPVKINVKIDYGEVAYDHDHTREEISEKLAQIQGAGTYHAAGLTIARFRTEINARMQIFTNEKGEGCLYLRSIDLDLGYPQITVYVENKYKEDSCEYQAVLEHEHTHVSIHQKALEYYAPYVQQAAAHIAQQIPPYYIKDKKQADEMTSQIIQTVRNYIHPLLEQFEEQKKEQHALLDSSKSYEYTQSKCKDWQ